MLSSPEKLMIPAMPHIMLRSLVEIVLAIYSINCTFWSAACANTKKEAFNVGIVLKAGYNGAG
jgi:hypothetical protein